MRQTINDTQGVEKLRTGLYAGAATVGRPSGVEGKNRIPRRPKMTKKEVDKLKSGFPEGIKKPLKAGGPGSGRRSTGQKDHEDHQQRLHDRGKQIMEGPKKVPEYKEATKVASYKGHTIHNEPFKHQGAGAQRFVVRDKRGAKSGPSHSSLKNAKDEIDMWNK